MEQLIDRIRALENVSRELEPSQDARREYLRRMVDYSESFLGDLHSAKAYVDDYSRSGNLAIDGDKQPIVDLLKIYSEEVAEKGIRASSPGHLGYIPGGGLFASAIADFLADITNEYAGVYFPSPGAVNIENELLDWLKKIFGFPGSAAGNLASGGSIATLVALTAARDKLGIKGSKVDSAVVYLGAQTHHCVEKTLRIIGLSDITIRNIKLDARSRIDPGDLASKIDSDQANGLLPFLVVASAGTTDTGAVDPLSAIGEIASANNAWYHIDAAYGGFFILCKSKEHLLEGIETADSLVVDPHKGLFLPFGIGAVLVKDTESVLASNQYIANYMQDAVGDNTPQNPADVSPELTKHFRGLRMWLPLKLHGVKPFVACLEEKLLLTKYFRKRLTRIGFAVGPEPDLSISYFWYPVEGIDQDEFNRELLGLVHRDGRVFLSSTITDDRFVIRMAILSFRTKLDTIDLAVEMLESALTRCLSKFDRQRL